MQRSGRGSTGCTHSVSAASASCGAIFWHSSVLRTLPCVMLSSTCSACPGMDQPSSDTAPSAERPERAERANELLCCSSRLPFSPRGTASTSQPTNGVGRRRQGDGVDVLAELEAVLQPQQDHVVLGVVVPGSNKNALSSERVLPGAQCTCSVDTSSALRAAHTWTLQPRARPPRGPSASECGPRAR